jgi:hypothetical protein
MENQGNSNWLLPPFEALLLTLPPFEAFLPPFEALLLSNY